MQFDRDWCHQPHLRNSIRQNHRCFLITWRQPSQRNKQVLTLISSHRHRSLFCDVHANDIFRHGIESTHRASSVSRSRCGRLNVMVSIENRQLLFSAILRQEISFFDDEENSTGALTSKLSTDAQYIQGASGVTLGTILQVLTNILGGILISLIYGWKLALVATAMLPFTIGAGTFRLKIMDYFRERTSSRMTAARSWHAKRPLVLRQSSL